MRKKRGHKKPILILPGPGISSLVASVRLMEIPANFEKGIWLKMMIVKMMIALIAITLLVAVASPADAGAGAANAGYVSQVQGGMQPAGGYGSSLGCPGCPGNPIKKPGEPVCY